LIRAGICEYTFASALCEILDNAIEATRHVDQRRIDIKLNLNNCEPLEKVQKEGYTLNFSEVVLGY
jgi:hypothetical protein